MSAEPKRDLDDLIAAWWLEQDDPTVLYDGVEHIASTHLAEAIVAAGWVSPEEHAAALDDLHEGVDQVNRVSALAADLQRRGDSETARLIFAALNGERA